jgi:hypothetical protein
MQQKFWTGVVKQSHRGHGADDLEQFDPLAMPQGIGSQQVDMWTKRKLLNRTNAYKGDTIRKRLVKILK